MEVAQRSLRITAVAARREREGGNGATLVAPTST